MNLNETIQAGLDDATREVIRLERDAISYAGKMAKRVEWVQAALATGRDLSETDSFGDIAQLADAALVALRAERLRAIDATTIARAAGLVA